MRRHAGRLEMGFIPGQACALNGLIDGKNDLWQVRGQREFAQTFEHDVGKQRLRLW